MGVARRGAKLHPDMERLSGVWSEYNLNPGNPKEVGVGAMRVVGERFVWVENWWRQPSLPAVEVAVWALSVPGRQGP